MHDAPYMEGLMRRIQIPRESWAFGEHKDCVYVDLQGNPHPSSCFKLHAWNCEHRFFKESMDRIARRFRMTSEGCMEFRRLATVFESHGDSVACRREMDATWDLCKGVAAKALEDAKLRRSSSSSNVEEAVSMTSDATREVVLLMRTEAEGCSGRAIVYMHVGQENTAEDSATFWHVERVEPSMLGEESLTRALMGRSAMWDMVPLNDGRARKVQEKMHSFLMYTHARLGENCCPWLIDIDPAVFQGVLYETLARDSLEFEDVLAVIGEASEK